MKIEITSRVGGGTPAEKLREVILTELLDKKAPSETGLAFLKNEVHQLW